MVGTTPILLSDVNLATLLRLADVDPEAPAEAQGAATLEARIRLEVQYRSLEASGTVFRLELDVAAVQEALVERAGGRDLLGSLLEPAGLSWSDVEQLAVRSAAARAFVEQRLRPRVSISMEEIEAAYRSIVVDHWDPSLEPPPPLLELKDQLHRLVVERKLNDEIERWIEQSREQIEVTVYRPRPAPTVPLAAAPATARELPATGDDWTSGSP